MAGKGKPKGGKKRKPTAAAGTGARRGRPKLQVLLDRDGQPETLEERKRRLARERQKRKQDRNRTAVDEVQVLRRQLRESEILHNAILDGLAKAIDLGRLPKQALVEALKRSDAAVLKSDRKLGLTARGMTERLVDHVAEIVAGLDRPFGEPKPFFAPPDLDELDEITSQDLQDAFYPKFEGHIPNDGPPDDIRFLSLFSGIGGADLAYMRRGWHALAHAEIDRFPSRVLAARFPGVTNLGDVEAVDWEAWRAEYGPVDVLVGGAPCQAFSQAGKRKGIADPRGNLSLHFLRIAKEVQADAFIFENVPKILQSPEGDPGRDFGLLLAAVREAGYSACWAILDTRHFGPPQRRERFYMVGFRGKEWAPAAHALLRPICSWPEETLAANKVLLATDGANPPISFDDLEDAISADFRGWTNAGILHGGQVHMRKTVTWRESFGEGDDLAWTLDVVVDPDLTMSEKGVKGVARLQKDSEKNEGFWEGVALHLGEKEFVALEDAEIVRVDMPDGLVGHTSTATRTYMPKVAATLTKSQSLRKGSGTELLVGTDDGRLRVLSAEEWERLQGFPTGWTAVNWENGRPAGKTPRKEALGNAMSVPVLDWIGAGVEEEVRVRKQERKELKLFVALRDEMLRERKERGK